ncbi:hypothetical protein [Amnibacterium kyonggiense]|uniref:Uncharacterized protein n=1 Tax=Amnibacterium kyonggiense TaxID=595671 RepID=A0A4R7FSN0_9MICO|nr:hypothetical protein [Amnibacterium kyonggiense]TDS80853.1 hypothetical protein CLV52_1423 [Amnibacterium kyonggiense]
MPHERTLLTATPPTPETWLAALRAVVPDGLVQVLPGAAAQLVDPAGSVLATVTLPREVSSPTEARRLLDVDAAGRPWWSDVVVPRVDARLTAVLREVADRCDGTEA